MSKYSLFLWSSNRCNREAAEASSWLSSSAGLCQFRTWREFPLCSAAMAARQSGEWVANQVRVQPVGYTVLLDASESVCWS